MKLIGRKFLEKLEVPGLGWFYLLRVKGDGNCLFGALYILHHYFLTLQLIDSEADGSDGPKAPFVRSCLAKKIADGFFQDELATLVHESVDMDPDFRDRDDYLEQLKTVLYGGGVEMTLWANFMHANIHLVRDSTLAVEDVLPEFYKPDFQDAYLMYRDADNDLLRHYDVLVPVDAPVDSGTDSDNESNEAAESAEEPSVSDEEGGVEAPKKLKTDLEFDAAVEATVSDEECTSEGAEPTSESAPKKRKTDLE